ncbi:MAG TPA: redoxin domain-containing protein [Candidatus Dormibacteraeota bacterium]|nr:redoxin domain-containing protein [Candidatus Dormibacteraeota bacterium]
MSGLGLSGPHRSRTHPVPMWSLALPILVVVAAVAVASFLVLSNSGTKTASVDPGLAQVGKKAPGFTSWDLGGRKVSLDEFKGKPVLLTFWATWCTACQEELPALQQIGEQYRSSGLTVLAVDYRETDTARMSQFLTGLHVNMEAVVDPQGAIAGAFGVDLGLPVNVWLDRSHVVARVMVGAQPASTLDDAAAQLAAST